MYLHYTVSSSSPGQYPEKSETYQSRFGLSLEDLDSLNQACWSDVWLMTRSRINFMPLAGC